VQHLTQEVAKGATEGQDMNIYEIGLLMCGWLFSCVWFYTMGVSAGYTDGRRAVRQQVEQANKVRA
jgi:hypothetical protein